MWTLPAANQGAWEPGVDIGVDGGIDQYLAGGINDRAVTGTVIDVTQAPYSADNTGATAVDTAVQAAITAADPGDVVYFPAGTFKFDTGFINWTFKDNVTVRGAGRGVTTLHGSTVFHLFVFDGNDANTNQETVTGTKTKGRTVLAIADTTSYEVGKFVQISYENETDNTRIQAGAAPVWHSAGGVFARTYLAKITAVSANASITVDPGLPGDATNLELRVITYAADQRTVGWGWEDFTVTFDDADHPAGFVTMNLAEGCWVHNVEFSNFSKETSSGSCVNIFNSYKCEVRKCIFHGAEGRTPNTRDDGAIGTGLITSCLLVDNIFSGEWDLTWYDNGNTCNSAFCYNFSTSGIWNSLSHGAHPSLNLWEGNCVNGHQFDGYHGSASHCTLFRNWFKGPFCLTVNRFNRQHVVTGNIIGADGTQDGDISWGNPNIGNGTAYGFAGPTGLSAAEGTLDYSQRDIPGFFQYEIQAEDIFAGDFWADWKITGTLTTRTSDTLGTFTVSGGQWYTGAPHGAYIVPTVRWNSGVDAMQSILVDGVVSVDDDLITIQFATGVLPAQDTAVTIFPGAIGWQERDLDVQASSTAAHNYRAEDGGEGAVTNSISPDTLPDSLMYDSKPEWFGELAWPPFNPNDYSTADPERIPAGFRFVNEEDPPAEGGGGTITATTVNATTVTVTP